MLVVADLSALPAAVGRLAAGRERVLVGLTGAPAVGKSTVAEWLCQRLTSDGLPATCVPMDGFHLANSVLERLGRRDRKGAPDTFDAHGYVALLARLRAETGHTVYAPRFHREIEESYAGEIVVAPDVRVVVTEGNYLLVDAEPWRGVRPALDAVWYLSTDEDTRMERLVRRHIAGGKPPDLAREWAYGSDQRNAELIAATKHRADGEVYVS